MFIIAVNIFTCVKLTSLTAKAPALKVTEANKDLSNALTASYSSYDEASTALAGAQNNYKNSKTSLDNLVKSVSKFELQLTLILL